MHVNVKQTRSCSRVVIPSSLPSLARPSALICVITALLTCCFTLPNALFATRSHSSLDLGMIEHIMFPSGASHGCFVWIHASKGDVVIVGIRIAATEGNGHVWVRFTILGKRGIWVADLV